MQVQAIYDRGHLVFNQPFQFVTERFPVVIEFPDNLVRPPTGAPEPAAEIMTASPAAEKLLSEIQKILGPLARPRPHTSVQEDKTAYGDALEEKHGL